MEYIGISANERRDPSPSPASYPTHSHGSYEIFLPISHTCIFEVGNYQYTVDPSSILLLPPGENHRLLVKESTPLDYLYVQFAPHTLPKEKAYRDTVDSLFPDGSKGNQSMWRLSRASFDYVRAAMKRLCTVADPLVYESFFGILLPLLNEIRLFGTPVVGESQQPTTLTPPQSSLVDEVIEYISLNYADIRDLSFVTERFHYSTVHVNALFKARLGVSLWHYILQIRLDRSCDLLLGGTRAEAVASICGFGDYSTFYRMFKKCYGISPSECRKTGKKPPMLR